MQRVRSNAVPVFVEEDTVEQQEVSNKIFTIPNVISFARLCLVPIFLILLFDGHNISATVLFAMAAGTDWIDGQIARRTNSVSKLGQILDPAVDRILMISGVVGLLIVGRIPLWIPVIVLLRDGFLLIAGAYLLKKWKVRVAVIYPGKVVTTFLFVGFAGLLLNWPLIPGLNVTDITWLPGLNDIAVSWGIWFVYAGLVLGVFTTTYYIYRGATDMHKAKLGIAAGSNAQAASEPEASALSATDDPQLPSNSDPMAQLSSAQEQPTSTSDPSWAQGRADDEQK